MLHAFLQDLRYGLRVLLRMPGYAATAVIALALGIGANTAIFSVVNSVLLRPLPYPEPDRIVQLWETDLKQAMSSVSPHCFNDWREMSGSFQSVAAYRYTSFTFTGGDLPEAISGAQVSAAFTEVMGVSPARGRSFLPEEDSPGKNRVVVISNGLWGRRFGSDPDLVGQTLVLNGEAHTVVGIMPAGFEFPNRGVDIWSPLGIDLAQMPRGSHFLFALGRLKPDVALQSAQSELDGIARQLEVQYPNDNPGVGIRAVRLRDQIVGDTRSALWILLGAVSFVLLIACANVANLLLARATSRQKEIAIRVALGAGRGRIVRQFLAESLLLSAIGGLAGLLLAMWTVESLIAGNGAAIPRSQEIGIDPAVLAFTILISLATGIVFGLVPALQFSRPDLNETLKDGSRGSSGGVRHQRMRSALVITEVALAVMLLVGAGLLIKSFSGLRQVDPGFQAGRVLFTTMSLPRARYAEPLRQAAFFERALEQAASVPGVQMVAATSELPFTGSRTMSSFAIEGRAPAGPGGEGAADLRLVSPAYFDTMGIPLFRGRDFNRQDTRNSVGVVIVSEAMAKQFWPNEDPIGKRLSIGSPLERSIYEGPVWREVIGVVGSVRHMQLAAAKVAEMYVPHMQYPNQRMDIAIRADTDMAGLRESLRAKMKELDALIPVGRINRLSDRVDQSIGSDRLMMTLLSVFAGLAAVLAAVGIYGVISYSVTQRTHELGIRMALGAGRADVMKLVVGQGMGVVLIGMALGLIGAFFSARLLAGLLFGVRPFDPATFALISLGLGVIALLACAIPAVRATRVDPMIALRHE